MWKLGENYIHSEKLLDDTKRTGRIAKNFIKSEDEHAMPIKPQVKITLKLLGILTTSNNVFKGPWVGATISEFRFDGLTKSTSQLTHSPTVPICGICPVDGVTQQHDCFYFRQKTTDLFSTLRPGEILGRPFSYHWLTTPFGEEGLIMRSANFIIIDKSKMIRLFGPWHVDVGMEPKRRGHRTGSAFLRTKNQKVGRKG